MAENHSHGSLCPPQRACPSPEGDVRVQINTEGSPSPLTNQHLTSWPTYHRWSFLGFLKTVGSFHTVLEALFQEEVHSGLAYCEPNEQGEVGHHPGHWRLLEALPIPAQGSVCSSQHRCPLPPQEYSRCTGECRGALGSMSLDFTDKRPHIKQWFSAGVVLLPQGTFVNVQRHL